MTFYFWVILLAVLAYGWLHSFLDSLNTKAHARNLLEAHTDQWFCHAYNFMAVITLLPMLIPGLRLPFSGQ